jgi:hypothetical protein
VADAADYCRENDVGRFVRFVVRHRIKGQPKDAGVFAAAYDLRRRAELLDHDRDRLERLLEWFRSALKPPPTGSIPPMAIFWYRNVGPFSERMWELVQLLKEYDIIADQISSGFVGKIVYYDKHQVAAILRRRSSRE